jgi:hypothetical protein
MTLNFGWGSEIDADQNPKAVAISAQTMLITSAQLLEQSCFISFDKRQIIER